MFDPQAVTTMLFKSAVEHPVEMLTHLVAYSSAAVAGLACAERLLRATQDWAYKWFPNSRIGAWVSRVEYGVSAAADLIEMLALNWRDKIAPKPRDVWDDAERQKQLGEKSLSATAGKN